MHESIQAAACEWNQTGMNPPKQGPLVDVRTSDKFATRAPCGQQPASVLCDTRAVPLVAVAVRLAG